MVDRKAGAKRASRWISILTVPPEITKRVLGKTALPDDLSEMATILALCKHRGQATFDSTAGQYPDSRPRVSFRPTKRDAPPEVWEFR